MNLTPIIQQLSDEDFKKVLKACHSHTERFNFRVSRLDPMVDFHIHLPAPPDDLLPPADDPEEPEPGPVTGKAQRARAFLAGAWHYYRSSIHRSAPTTNEAAYEQGRRFASRLTARYYH